MTFTDEDIDDWVKFLRKGAANRANKEDVFAHTADMLEQLQLDRAFLRVEAQQRNDRPTRLTGLSNKEV